MFSLGDNFNYDNTQFKFLTNNTFFINESTVYDIHSWDNILRTSVLDYRGFINPTSTEAVSLTNYVNDISVLTPMYNDITTLTEFFPERVMHFENFELSNLENDEGVFEALSTPDLKIFYPEPFVASPSFVHEDL